MSQCSNAWSIVLRAWLYRPTPDKMLRNIAHLELPEVVQMLLLSFLWIAHEPVTFVLKVTRVLLTLGLSETCFDTLQFWAKNLETWVGSSPAWQYLESILKESRKTYENMIFDCLWLFVKHAHPHIPISPNLLISHIQSAIFSQPALRAPCSQCSCSAMTPGT